MYPLKGIIGVRGFGVLVVSGTRVYSFDYGFEGFKASG